MKRLSYIDWMRGLACVVMFQTHCYDSWLSPQARHSSFFAWSQLGGTLPAPLFVFLAGVSFALVTERLREKGIARNAIAKQTIRRGAEIFGLALLFRVQEFALGYPWSPWTDLLRVDILNILGLSMILMGVLCWFVHSNDPAAARTRSILVALASSAAISMLTPPIWTTHRQRFLPWPIESISTACTFSTGLSPGSSLCSPGPPLPSPVWPPVSFSLPCLPSAAKSSRLCFWEPQAFSLALYPFSLTARPSISTPFTTTGTPALISSSCVAAFSLSFSSSSTPGAAGDLPRRASVRSFSSARLRFSSIGFTSSSFTAAFRSSRSAVALSPPRRSASPLFFFRCCCFPFSPRAGRSPARSPLRPSSGKYSWEPRAASPAPDGSGNCLTSNSTQSSWCQS